VAKKLALQQACRNRGAIHLYERSAPSRTEAMNRFRDQFLARSGFALDQHRRTRWRHRSDQLHHLSQRSALAHNALKLLFVGLDLRHEAEPVRAWLQGRTGMHLGEPLPSGGKSAASFDVIVPGSRFVQDQRGIPCCLHNSPH